MLRTFPAMLLVCVFSTALEGQDRSDWQALAQLRAGDALRLSLKSGQVKGAFQNWTALDVTAGKVTAKKEDVVRIERYRQSGGRGKSAGIGALIGFGGGFVAGVVADPPCRSGEFICLRVSRGITGLVGGTLGAGVGAGIGALLPRHSKDLIYSAK